ncbi:MAG: Fic family protein [Spirochaeta sp.]|jgi:Fic family protein|nr:Fic family protein [Spirochaeta sp.]
MVSDMAISERLHRSISGKKRELDRRRPFPPAVLRRLTEEFTLEWTYNSNAIEGNTLSLRETELVMNRGLTIGGESLREHFEVVNHAEAIAFLEAFVQKKTDLSEEFICGLHRIILKNIDDLEAGTYRRHTVRIVGATHIPPRATKVRGLVSELIEWYEQHAHLKPIPELAAEILSGPATSRQRRQGTIRRFYRPVSGAIPYHLPQRSAPRRELPRGKRLHLTA